ncbi:Serine/threonine-protein kinase ULK2 [Toxocara canis]|uniref:Serine/threonine-protein kinase ULK2 n=1 Tax=Toxocara canis TaxID=6265 RepID=A0A0B2VWA8_TOXCA|nr:Serine/threonine-protein kinase ULK2 [Toxocara canis]
MFRIRRLTKADVMLHSEGIAVEELVHFSNLLNCRMGGAKLDDCSRGVKAEHIDTELQMGDDSFTNERVFVDYGSYEYRDCAASCIGHGSFGQVFRGIETTSGVQVAIKKMAKNNVKPNELKVMQSVSSRFLVALIDVCIDDADSAYIIMELCDIDLEHHLKYCTPSGALSKNELRTLMDNVIRGYKALYDCCIVHRDIKPQNILIKYGPIGRELESAKISDFGISRILDEEQEEALSNVAGTFYYMAPEVGANLLRTCGYDYQVDMWSLGCLFYQCITGQVPFDERSLCRIFLYAACGNYEAYEKPELPAATEEELELIVSSLLEIDRNKRITPSEIYAAVCAWSSSGASCISDDVYSYQSDDRRASITYV